jgi:hypothetical protein
MQISDIYVCIHTHTHIYTRLLWDRVLLFCSDWYQTSPVILLPLPPECWSYWHGPLCPPRFPMHILFILELNSGPHTCEAGTLTFETLPQPIFIGYLFIFIYLFEIGSHFMPRLCWTVILFVVPHIVGDERHVLPHLATGCYGGLP